MLTSSCDIFIQLKLSCALMVLSDWIVEGVKYTEENNKQTPDAIEIGDW